MTETILGLIGNTPLLKMDGEDILVKAEFLNPGGSIKDRIALSMIEGAEKRGELKAGSVIVEPTSGNTGIGLAMVGRLKGYRTIIVMPEGMSEERKHIIRAFGAELVLTPDELSLGGSVTKAHEIAADLGDQAFVPNQFENPDNPRIHYEETARELWEQSGGKISCFVAGVGSGGTLQGIGKFLKEKNPDIRVIAVEPKNVAALLGHEPGLHAIQGIGDGFIPGVLDVDMVDEVIEVTDNDAVETAKDLCKNFGFLVGISSGANVWAARQAAKNHSGNIATILPDRAERYFSTSLIF